MGDKRRYISKNPSPRRDKVVAMSDSGNAAADGYTVRYRNKLPRAQEDDYRRDSLYRESYNCDGLMTDDEARMQRMYGDLD